MVKSAVINKMTVKEFRAFLKTVDKVRTLQKVKKIVEEDEDKLGAAEKTLKKLVKQVNDPEIEMNEFKDRIKLEENYNTLNRYRKVHAEDVDKCRIIYNHLKSLAKDGGLTVKRRKPDTGVRKEVEEVYKDTLENRNRGRVGQTYKRVVWEDAEYEEVPRKIRKRKRTTGEKKHNPWTDSLAKAKEELGAPKYVTIRKEGDPDDIGVKVYKRAIEILQKYKEEKAAAN